METSMCSTISWLCFVCRCIAHSHLSYTYASTELHTEHGSSCNFLIVLVDHKALEVLQVAPHGRIEPQDMKPDLHVNWPCEGSFIHADVIFEAEEVSRKRLASFKRETSEIRRGLREGTALLAAIM
jgi:hypothetical protein